MNKIQLFETWPVITAAMEKLQDTGSGSLGLPEFGAALVSAMTLC